MWPTGCVSPVALMVGNCHFNTRGSAHRTLFRERKSFCDAQDSTSGVMALAPQQYFHVKYMLSIFAILLILICH